VLVTAQGRHPVERADDAAGHEALIPGALRSHFPITAEVEPPLVAPFVEQMGADVLLPAPAVSYCEVHMFRRAGTVLEPAQ